MRRCACLLLVCLLLLSVTLPAYADDMTEYELKELGMTISLPSDYTVVTRDNLNSLSLEGTDQTQESLLAELEAGNLYLCTWEPGLINTWEINVTVDENSFGIGIDELLLIMSSYDMSDAMGEKGISDWDVYTTPAATFLKTTVTMQNGLLEQHVLRYFTIRDDIIIYINMFPTLGELEEEDKAILEMVVDGIRFDATLSPDEENGTEGAAESAATDAARSVPELTYTDEVTHVSFNIPEGWAEVPFNVPKEFYKAKFAPQEANGICSIMYGWQELPEELSSEEIGGYSELIKLYIKMLMPEGEGEPESVTYGDNEYCVISGPGSTFGITYPVQMAICITGRYLFVFNFVGMGENTDKLLQDFESMLASVEFAS